MKKLAFLLPVLGTLLLSGCGNDPKETNEENFKVAIAQHLDKVGCATLNPVNMPYEKLTDKAWPIQVDASGFYDHKELDALVTVGLLTVEEKEIVIQRQGYKRMIEQKKKVRVYDLTDLGRKTLKSPDSLSFCRFNNEIEKVTGWNDPFQRGGETFVKVQTSVKVKNVQEWINHPEVVKADALNMLTTFRENRKDIHDGDTKNMSFVLKLTEKGWVVEG